MIATCTTFLIVSQMVDRVSFTVVKIVVIVVFIASNFSDMTVLMVSITVDIVSFMVFHTELTVSTSPVKNPLIASITVLKAFLIASHI